MNKKSQATCHRQLRLSLFITIFDWFARFSNFWYFTHTSFKLEVGKLSVMLPVLTDMKPARFTAADTQSVTSGKTAEINTPPQ